MEDNTRRILLKVLTTLPIIGASVLAMHALLRYFRPTLAGGVKALMSPPDEIASAPQVAATLNDLTKPWDFKEFIYVRTSVEYSANKTQGAKIPGFVVRLPDAVPGVDLKDPKTWFVVVQRICPHLGCTFNFIPNREELSGGYNFAAPDPFHPYFACPCHLSVYDPTRAQKITGTVKGVNFDELPGKVVSGPAPRPPRTMSFDIVDNKILITDTEGGGIG